MKKRDDNKKEVTKIKLKKTKDSMVNRRTSQRKPDPWKEIRLKLKPLSKAYNKFREKRRIAKEKEEQRRLKAEEEQRLEEKRIKEEKKIKKEEERRLKAQEKQRLEEKRIKEEREERIRQKQIYKKRLIKGEQERIKQLERVSKLREEERKLREERILKINSRFDEKKRLKEEKRIELEQRLKEEEKINLKEERRLDDEQKKKRLNGTVKWFNDAKGYGFIKRKGEEKDIFVHFSAVQNSGLKYLKDGEQLTFEIEYSDKGLSAINLQKTVNEVSRSYLKVIK